MVIRLQARDLGKFRREGEEGWVCKAQEQEEKYP